MKNSKSNTVQTVKKSESHSYLDSNINRILKEYFFRQNKTIPLFRLLSAEQNSFKTANPESELNLRK